MSPFVMFGVLVWLLVTMAALMGGATKMSESYGPGEFLTGLVIFLLGLLSLCFLLSPLTS